MNIKYLAARVFLFVTGPINEYEWKAVVCVAKENARKAEYRKKRADLIKILSQR